MRLFVAIVASVMLLAAACTDGGQSAVSAAAEDTAASTAISTTPQATAVSASTTGPETTAGPESTTLTTAPSPSTPTLPPLLAFDGNGIRVVDDARVVVEFLAGVPVQAAAPDLTGGVVYQQAGAAGWVWECDATSGRVVYGGEGAAPIMRIAQPGAPAEMLVPADDGPGTLLRTFWLDGRPTLMYRAVRADPEVACRPDDVETTWAAVAHHLVLLRLDDGTVTQLGVVAGFESSWVDYVIGESTMVVLTESYGELDLCGGIWQSAALLAAAGDGMWLGEGGPFWRRCDFAAGGVALRAAVSRNGATVAYVTTSPSGDAAALFVVLDAATGSVLRRVTVEGWSLQPAWLDWDGAVAVFGDFEATAPVVVMGDGSLIELPAGTYATTWPQP